MSAIVVAILAGPALAAPLQSPGCLDGGTPAVVQAVADDLELRLDDGRVVRLAGLDSPDEATSLSAEHGLRQWLAGQSVRVVALGPEPTDRWGRVRGLVFAAGGADQQAVSVGEALLDAGLARARPSAAIAPCWGAYLRLEDGAWEARRGLWAAGGIIGPGDQAALRAHLGRFVIVEGAVDSLFQGRSRTYLRLAGGPPGGGLAMSFDRRTATRLAKAGLDPERWRNRRVRVRGTLDDRWGLQIDVTTPEQIELLGP